MRVNDVMRRQVVTMSPATSLREAHAKMRKNNFRHIVVVEGKEIVGILSDRDVFIRSTKGLTGLDVPLIPLVEVMTTSILTCRAESTVASVAELMVAAKIDALPVVDGLGNLVGIVTSTDLLNVLADNGRVAPEPPQPKVASGQEDEPRRYPRTPVSYLT